MRMAGRPVVRCFCPALCYQWLPMNNTPRRTAWIVAKFALVAGGFVIFGILARRYNLPLQEIADRAPVYGAPALWAAIVGLYAIVSVLPAAGRDLLKFLAAAVLGWWSIIAIWLGELLAAAAGFGVTRFGGRDFVELMMGQRIVGLNEKLRGATWRSILVLRLLPVTPYRYMNYAAGLVDVPFGPYMWGSAIGMLLRTAFFQILFTVFADRLKAWGVTLWQTFVFSLCLVPAMILVWWIVQRVRRARAPRADGQAS
jgi:uncharacterized membrane protein YdjX (TVP38/TMEM64 family)